MITGRRCEVARAEADFAAFKMEEEMKNPARRTSTIPTYEEMKNTPVW
jgi:hypothetical protein